LALLHGCGGRGEPAAAPASASYVGADACRSCHAEVFSTFSRTGMGRSFYPLTADRVIEDWTGNNTFTSASSGLRYRMERRDGRFYMRQFLDDGRGGETAVDERQLAYVVGSAHHSRTYLVSWGGKLYQAPVCWYTKDALWDLCPGYEHDNDYFSREIGRTCVFCHNGRMTLIPGARNAYAEPYPHGINCERCHGPGGEHVARWGRGESPTGEGDPSIVNPRRLTPDLRMQICFQCHLGDSKATERVARQGKPLEDFRPGETIAAAMVPFRFAEATAHDFGLSAQADRMLLSRCFTESGGKLECVTCHNPHVTVYRKDRPADFFTSKCVGCHELASCKAPAAARRATNPPDDCVACHMRRGEPDDHRHADFTDHWIRRRIDEEPRARTSKTLIPYLPEAFGAMSAGERSFAEARAYSLRALAMAPRGRGAMWPEAESRFRESIAQGNDGADAWFFLGKAQAARGEHAEAETSFARAFEKDPGDHDVAFAQGQSLVRAKRLDEAERVFEAMTRAHPESAAPWAELARCAALRRDLPLAVERYQKAIALEPWNASLHENEAKLLSSLGRHAEAVAAAEEALRYAPERESVRELVRLIKSRVTAS
jgi:Tfp pilus assembly protein PilF